MFLLFFRETKCDSAYEGYIFTNHISSHLWIVSKSVFIISAALIELSTIMYKLVSFAKSRIHDCISATIYLCIIKKSNGSRIDP